MSAYATNDIAKVQKSQFDANTYFADVLISRPFHLASK